MATKQGWRTTASLFVGMLTVASVVAAQSSAPKVGPRDQVVVAVFGVEKLSGKFPVDADGTLNYPLIGTMRVAGLTARELEAEIGRRLKDDGLFTVVPQVTVELEQTPNKRVTVTGAVRSPGTLQYAGDISLLEALVRAGSTNADAGEEVLIVRGGKDSALDADNAEKAATAGSEVVSVNLRSLEGGDVGAHNVALQDGDLVIVQKALSVYISGQVRSPGAYRVPAGATVLQALSLAGGLSERGSQRGIRIIRDRKEVDHVNLETVVQPGDTIIIRASLF